MFEKELLSRPGGRGKKLRVPDRAFPTRSLATRIDAKRLQQKCRSLQRMISPPTKIQIPSTTVAAQSSMQFFGRIENMLIGTLLFVGFVVATGAAIVKAFEWHQDVLHGPYLKRMD